MLLSAVPFAISGLRNRPRAIAAAAIAAGFVAFLCAGAFATLVVAGCAVLGGPCGMLRRRGHGTGALALLAAVVAPLSAGAVVGVGYVFSAARELTLGTMQASVNGVVRIAEALRLPDSAGHGITSAVNTLFADWAPALAAAVIVGVLAELFVTNAFVILAGRRVRWLAQADPFDAAARADELNDAPVAPLPLEFAGVGFGHPPTSGRAAAKRDALVSVDLTIEPGEFVAIVGPNGAGKSTLVSLLAGTAPTRGTVTRPGRVGLGLPGGTALVGQRAEAQVIGSTVAADLRWGLPEGYPVDAEALLSSVGLSGLGDASTESLSGGQLQRLAIAAAMARKPALLISDESTSMLDAAGRADILELLAALPARYGTAVVHVTHDPAEAARADRVVGLAEGRIGDAARAGRVGGKPAPMAGDAEVAESAPVAGEAPASAPGKPVIVVRGVGHRFDAGSPWEVTALRSVDLEVREGEGVLITGGNGSGKSTLAWVLAGLIRPTEGTVTVDGAPAAGSVGAVALSFQHARLQLQRPTVGEDILAAAGARRPLAGGDTFVADSLRLVGLPEELAGRGVDELSGGQMRRVAIAGLLAAQPRVLILDEPLAGLDRESRRGLLELLAKMRRDRGLTLVVISHDFEDMDLACSRTVEIAAGSVVAPDVLPGVPSGAGAGPAGPVRRPKRGLVFRAVPGTSRMHRVGAPTKIVVLAIATVVSLALPGWYTVGLLAALLAVCVVGAKLPATVIPRVPWLVAAITIAGAVAAAAGSGIVLYVQSMLLTVLFFALSLLLIWTTRIEELPAAFSRLAAPLRRVGLPVGEWAHAMTFAVRMLPLLRDELAVLIAGRRLRAAGRRLGLAAACREFLDLLIAVVASAGRRAFDLGRAATQRGGLA
jgi:energy-coupling factor transport system ATP-binding protein